jgi:cysteine desulfurase/selenocysteine lyase
MSTSDVDFAGLTGELARLANQWFGAAPGSVPNAPSTAAPALPASPSALTFPPASHGSASPPGAGGSVVPAERGDRSFGPVVPHTAPPFPGFVQQPPIASAPLLRESDLRPGVTLLSDAAGIGSPAALDPPAGADAAPYFLALGGVPGAPPAPGAAPTAGSTLDPLAAALGAPWSSTPFGAPYDATVPLVGEPPGAAPPAPAPTSPVPSSPAPASAAHDPLKLGPGTRPFDAHRLRRDFPILQERVHGNRPLIWLDNGATTQKPHAVIDRLDYFYRHENSNIHRAAHELAARATDAYEGARNTVRRFLNAPQSKDIVFVRGATEAINLVAQSWGRKHIGPGDEIVISWLEHHANIVPWQMLAAEKGAKLRVAPVDNTGQIILEELEKLLGSRTKLVSVTQVSNALGTVTPAKEIVSMAHRYGARALIDGAQAVLHMPVDVQDLDADFYVFSGHKIFAPTGIGALYGKSDVLEHMPPWQGGGNMIGDVTFEKTSYQGPPWRFEAGTGNIADAAGLGAALDYVSAVGLENIQRYEHELLVYGTERLRQVPGLRLLGTAADKAGVFSFVIDGLRTEDIGAALDQEGIAVRAGHHCAQPILRRFGVETSVRASLALYNSCEDLDALVDSLLRLTAGRPRTR